MMWPMKLHESVELPGPLERVHELLLEPSFREEVARRSGAQEVTVSVDREAGASVVTVDSRQSTSGMPAMATRFLGDQLAIHQVERWTSEESGTITVTIPGQPGQVEGTLRLAERGGVTAQTVQAEVTVKIPLVGGKVEKLIASVVGHVLALQAEVGAERLGG